MRSSLAQGFWSRVYFTQAEMPSSGHKLRLASGEGRKRQGDDGGEGEECVFHRLFFRMVSVVPGLQLFVWEIAARENFAQFHNSRRGDDQLLLLRRKREGFHVNERQVCGGEVGEVCGDISAIKVLVVCR